MTYSCKNILSLTLCRFWTTLYTQHLVGTALLKFGTQTFLKAISAALKTDKLLFTNKNLIDADADRPEFKIRRNFGQLQTFTANISGVSQHTENR